MSVAPLLLVVEDEPADQLQIELALGERAKPPRLEFTESGEAALRRLAAEEVAPPSLILLDLNLPGMSGHDLLARLREHPRWRRIPVVVLSTSDAPHDIDRSYELGASSYLTKARSQPELERTFDAFAAYWLEVAKLPTR